VSDVEITRTETLTRQEAARRLAALASALADGGDVEMALGSSAVTLRVPDQLRCEVEIEVDGAEVGLEVELTWRTAAVEEPAGPAEPAVPAPDAAEPGTPVEPRRRSRAAG
jgi:amphi-Trp domain-containing protein